LECHKVVARVNLFFVRTALMKVLAALIVLVGLAICAPPQENGVYVLNGNNFDDFVASQDYTLVEFYVSCNQQSLFSSCLLTQALINRLLGVDTANIWPLSMKLQLKNLVLKLLLLRLTPLKMRNLLVYSKLKDFQLFTGLRKMKFKVSPD
jgi:hypothetical protein